MEGFENLTNPKAPVCVLVMGMAGSGKTTLLQRLSLFGSVHGFSPYVLNLDPAVTKLPYQANIDIRDTVNYKQVMSSYGLGPNGAILTSLNLFATRFEGVLAILEKRAKHNYQINTNTQKDNSIDNNKDNTDTVQNNNNNNNKDTNDKNTNDNNNNSDNNKNNPDESKKDPLLRYILVDTPGQLEVFTWSASGLIISDSIGASFPTVALYIVDTPRSLSPTTFMSNMLYACSILYKTRLPFILCFNKIDVSSSSLPVEWMTDFDSLSEALRSDDTYMSSLSRSMGLVLEEFYKNIRAVSVSAVTGEGIQNLYNEIDKAKEIYVQEYVPSLIKMKKARDEKIAMETNKMKKKLEEDLQNSKGDIIISNQKKQKLSKSK